MARKMKRLALVAVIAAVATGFAVTPASADSRGPLPPEDALELPSEAGLGASAPEGGVSLNVVIGGVSGCYGQTDNPHASGHYIGTVDVESRTVCPGRTSLVQTSLYRSRWYGWEGWGYNQGTGLGSAAIVTRGGCLYQTTYTYLASSYHEAVSAGYAYTQNEQRFTCP